MNKHDTDNLQFILSLNEIQLAEWYDSLSDDDIEYASELMQEASVTVSLKVMEVQEIIHTNEANSLLKKFML
jgi:hypothetical protein